MPTKRTCDRSFGRREYVDRRPVARRCGATVPAAASASTAGTAVAIAAGVATVLSARVVRVVPATLVGGRIGSIPVVSAAAIVGGVRVMIAVILIRRGE